MKIDIDHCTEAELIELNHKIVARLRLLSEMRAHSQMLDFRIGDRVSFSAEGRPTLFGMVTRYNRKTLTVISDDGEHWNIPPRLLQRGEGENQAGSQNGRTAPRLPRVPENPL